MKVLLIQDVYKLGRAGDVKKVANGYGRNYLIPQGLAVLATPGALSQADRIRTNAEEKRNLENKELSGLAEQLSELRLIFEVKAGETGKLYGSVTTQMVADKINEELETKVDRRQIDSQPIRMLGVHTVNVRLTIDLIPEVTVWVHREGEPAESALTFSLEEAEAEAAALAMAEAQALAAEEAETAEAREEEAVEELEAQAEETVAEAEAETIEEAADIEEVIEETTETEDAVPAEEEASEEDAE